VRWNVFVRSECSEAVPPCQCREVIADALAAAKALWAEVNQKALDPTAPSGKDSSDVEMNNGLQRQLTIRYENLATSLSNPHPTKPVIDLFV